MKLDAELETVVARYRDRQDAIERYALKLREQGGYQDYETRLAWDMLKAIMGTTYICDLYDRYHCHDSHIDTLAKRALRMVLPDSV